ncbi:hypothetical protein NA56DRAFT_747541 [Hyaloscypha hepaticicola]|uniref:Uncharacterized protein n=1 Tax=Hyaloscypha hepaticicola TaxID=2082293 RepID=A0A2J6Q9J8_9HELO|nr:hypothetical protein NA56DRAFT_747541 [Hyaloscypha hepaticicola]
MLLMAMFDCFRYSKILTYNLDYDPVRDYENNSYSSRSPPELTHYKEYLRQQIPSLVTETIVTAIQKEVYNIGEWLKAQILEWVRTAQDRAITNYPVPATSSDFDAWTIPVDQPPISAIPCWRLFLINQYLF